MVQYDEKYYDYYENLDDDEEIEIPNPFGMFDNDDKFTASITTEEVNDPLADIRIDDDAPTTTIEEIPVISHKNTNTNKNKKKENAPTTTVTNKKKKQQKIALPPELREDFIDIFGENIVEDVFEMLMEDPSDEEDTRDIVCGILMEKLSQSDIDEAVASECILDIFTLFDVLFNAFDTTSDNPSEFTTSITTEEEESGPPADNIRIDDDDIPPTTIEEETSTATITKNNDANAATATETTTTEDKEVNDPPADTTTIEVA